MERVFINENKEENFLEATNTLETMIYIEIDKDINNNNEEPVTKTWLHGFSESHSIYELQIN